MDVISILREHGLNPGAVRVPGSPKEFDESITPEDVTPERAMEWIAATWTKYPTGRNFGPTQIDKIKQYAQDMTQGRWEHRPDADTIDITDGSITGGRHRLHAVLLSHTTQRFNVRYRTRKS